MRHFGARLSPLPKVITLLTLDATRLSDHEVVRDLGVLLGDADRRVPDLKRETRTAGLLPFRLRALPPTPRATSSFPLTIPPVLTPISAAF